ncbi:hypothetical protein BN1708_017346, partial [Verticillium longisporum]
FRRRHCRVPPI